jgi:Spy/CpxP family protein refolding chaperone
MKKRLITATALAAGLLVVLFAARVSAQQPESINLLKDQKLEKKLGITEEQQKRLRASVLETRKKTIELTARLKIARLELEQSLESASINREAIDKQVDEIARVKGDLLRAIVAQRIVAKETLTPEQRERLQTIVRQRLQERRERLNEIRRERGAAQRREMLPNRPERPEPPANRFRPGADKPQIKGPDALNFDRGEPGEIETALGPREPVAPPVPPLIEGLEDADLDEIQTAVLAEPDDLQLLNELSVE